MANPQEDISHRWRLIIALLGEAISADIYAANRMRYSTPEQEESRIKELRPLKAQAERCWMAAKHLYCDRKDAIDAYYENNEDIITASVDGRSSFEQMRKVIEEEMTQQLEKELLDSETKK